MLSIPKYPEQYAQHFPTIFYLLCCASQHHVLCPPPRHGTAGWGDLLLPSTSAICTPKMGGHMAF